MGSWGVEGITIASTNFYCWGGTLCQGQNESWYWDTLCLYKGLAHARVSLHLEETIRKDFAFFIFSKTKMLLPEPLCIFPLIKVKKLRFFLYKFTRSTGTLSQAQTGFQTNTRNALSVTKTCSQTVLWDLLQLLVAKVLTEGDTSISLSNT